MLKDPCPIARWKWHLGHTGVATAIAFVAFAFGAPLLWATFLGTVAWPLLQEGWQAVLVRTDWRDHVADFIQHQPVWVIYLLRSGEIVVAGLVLAVIVALYRLTLPWSQP